MGDHDGIQRLAHDLRNNLHALRIGLEAMDTDSSADNQTVIGLLKKEVDQASSNLNALVEMTRSRDE